MTETSYEHVNPAYVMVEDILVVDEEGDVVEEIIVEEIIVAEEPEPEPEPEPELVDEEPVDDEA